MKHASIYRCLLATVTCVSAVAGCAMAPRNQTVLVSYTPFGEETYIAVTPENIDRACVVCGAQQIPESLVKALLSGAKEPLANRFDRQRVRLKMKVGAETLLVDDAGIVWLQSANKSHQLTSADIHELTLALNAKKSSN